tara:strand:- start:1022 stop:1294 length:273 start_codon:yes stop_codon:yes gene_type:complete
MKKQEEQVKFEDYKEECIEMINECFEEECWYDEANDVERTEPIDCQMAVELKACDDFVELAKVMVEWEYWEMEDVIEKSKHYAEYLATAK